MNEKLTARLKSLVINLQKSGDKLIDPKLRKNSETLEKNYLSEVKNMDEKTSKKKLYYLVLDGHNGFAYYKLFMENDQIVEIKLARDEQQEYFSLIYPSFLGSVSLPCSFKNLADWLDTQLDKEGLPLVEEWSIHADSSKIRWQIKEFYSTFA